MAEIHSQLMPHFRSQLSLTAAVLRFMFLGVDPYTHVQDAPPILHKKSLYKTTAYPRKNTVIACQASILPAH